MFFHCKINDYSHTFHQLKTKNQIRKDKSSLPSRLQNTCICRERTSLFTPKVRASLTLEAACAVPVFLFAMIAVLYFVKTAEFAVRISGGICSTVKELGVLAPLEDTDSGQRERIPELAKGVISSAYAKQKIVKVAGIGEGEGTFQITKFQYLKSDEMISLMGRFKVKYPFPFFSLPEIKLGFKGVVRAWTGRDGLNGAGNSQEDGDMVLVAVNGSVYHRDPECTHIKLSIRQVLTSALKYIRNQSGAKYYSCETCKGEGDVVYVTDTGDRYHSTLGCSGLKRGLLLVSLSEAEKLGPCTRCAK